MGYTKSCGCLVKTNAVSHGLTKTREYVIWAGIKARCNNPLNPAYNRYGGKGITMCTEWEVSFEKFISDMGKCPIGLTIERIDNNKGYYKENCKWASYNDQAINRSSTLFIEYKGGKKPLIVWCKELKKDYKMVFARLTKLKWSIEDSLEK